VFNINTLLKDLVDWIIAEGLATSEGIDIFRDFSPVNPDNVIVLQEYDSILSPLKGNEAAVRYVQIFVRNTTASVAKSKCDLLFKLFMRPEESFTELPSGRIILTSPKNAPFKLSVDLPKTTYAFNVAITTNTDIAVIADNTAPILDSIIPLADSTDVSIDTQIICTFNEPIDLNTIRASNIFLTKVDTGEVVDGILTLSTNKLVVTFQPTNDLLNSIKYRIMLTTNIRDIAGNSLAAITNSDFTTVV
jgi:hypothetical protein